MLLLGLMLMNAATEVAGVASVLPLVAVAADPVSIQSQPWLGWLYRFGGWTDPHAFLVGLGVAFLVLLVMVNLVNALTWWACLRFGVAATHRLSTALLSRYLARPHAWFLRRNTIDLTRNVLDEIDQLVEHFVLRLAHVCMWATVAVFLVLGLLALDPLVAVLSATALSAMYIGIFRFFEARVDRLGRLRGELNGQRYRAVQQSVALVKEARARPSREHFLELYRRCSQAHQDVVLQHRLMGRMPVYFTESIAIAGIVLVLLYLVSTQRQMAVPMAGLYLMATFRLVPALQHTYGDLVEMRFYRPLLLSLAPEFESDPPIAAATDRLPLSERIEVAGVCFQYEEAVGPALRDVTLEVPRGTSVAFVGRTGAGKTTLADLISGHLSPSSGGVAVDGIPLARDNVDAWQANVGYVPQEIFLLDDTVRRNIAVGVPDDRIDDAAVREAARLACVDARVEALERGYDTVIGERGVNLSGGERQRIGIARALYHDPALLIFDEATSSLDNITENAVITALRGLAGRKTVIVIAHRLSTVQTCDTVCLLEDGRLISKGPYDELLRTCDQMRALAMAPGEDGLAS